MQGILSYYKQCFAHDSAEINLWSCHKLAEQDQLLLQGEDELASGFLPRLPLPHTLASTLMNRSALYLRERVLLHCSLFFSGTLELNGERRKVVTPLLYRECQIQADGDEIFLQASESLTGHNAEPSSTVGLSSPARITNKRAIKPKKNRFKITLRVVLTTFHKVEKIRLNIEGLADIIHSFMTLIPLC